jgi:hypothetical protein
MIRVLIAVNVFAVLGVSGLFLANSRGYDIPYASDVINDIDFYRTTCTLDAGRLTFSEQSWLNVTFQWSNSKWIDFEPGGHMFRSSDQPLVSGYPMQSIDRVFFGSSELVVSISAAEASSGHHVFRAPAADCRSTFVAYAATQPKLLMKSF